jgi:hypothetical protein
VERRKLPLRNELYIFQLAGEFGGGGGIRAGE